MKGIGKAGLIEAIESHGSGRRDRLKKLGIPRATYYRWKRRYNAQGSKGLNRRKAKRQCVWNRLTAGEEVSVLGVALKYPEQSPRLVAISIIDRHGFSVSESTVYRLLKREGLVRPRPLSQQPAAKQWQHKTHKPDEIWQCDAKQILIPGWGRYRAIPVIDDYSRKCLALPLKTDETSFSISDAVEQALENAQKEGHTVRDRPVLLSDNGPGFIGDVLKRYLQAKEIRQIHGAPYHPQTQGKVERFNRKIKESVCLIVYTSPDKLQQALEQFREQYNKTPHEALKNVSPNDVYAGKKEEVLKRRAEIKQATLQRRKRINLRKMV